MTLIDRNFLKEVTLDAVIKNMASLVSVKGGGPRKHSSIDYVAIDLYFSGNERCTAAVYQKVHVVNSLKAKMLISIDIFSSESFTIDTRNRKAMIGSCNNTVIPLEVAP